MKVSTTHVIELNEEEAKAVMQFIGPTSYRQRIDEQKLTADESNTLSMLYKVLHDVFTFEHRD